MIRQRAQPSAGMLETMRSVGVVIVSFNTRALTEKAVQSLLENSSVSAGNVVVWDNSSSDGSAAHLQTRFPDIRVIASQENLGFAKANNAAVRLLDTEFVVLLNSDTEVLPGALEHLVAAFSECEDAGIVGGRTLFADGSLNYTSCFNRMTPWSLFCSATGLSRAFASSRVFNPEAIGNWQRDTRRRVDIVTGCWALLSRRLWDRLGGFDEKYFMYGEDNDLSLRAREMGFRPLIEPRAVIVHHGGGSIAKKEEKLVQLLTGRATIIRDHWSRLNQLVGLALLRLFVVLRLASSLAGADPRGRPAQLDMWRAIWRRRREWLRGY